MSGKIALVALVLTTLTGRAAAEPVAVELFTSQGCSSCPPAEAYLVELADRGDVIALEWHVDYWDDLVHGAAGRWKDPFSSPDATARQSAYNARIGGRARGYTPQMVVAGQRAAIGSDRGRVEDAIRRLRKQANPLTLTVANGGAGGVRVEAKGASATLWRVDFLKAHETVVLRGENKGKRLESRHIVRGMMRLGSAGAGPISTPAPADGMGCAILAQIGQDGVGPILAAAYCP